MYEKFCDSYYLSQGLGRKVSSINIILNPQKTPGFVEAQSYETVRKGNEDFIVDNFGGSVKVKELELYNITYK